MRTKIFMGLVLSILGLTFFAGEVVWAAKRTIHRSPLLLPMDGATPPEAYTGPSPVMYEGGGQPDCEDIHPTIGYEYVIQHDQFGSTYYDKQKNGSMGRMIAVSSGGHRHTIFHETRGPYGSQYPRYVTYNCKNPASVWCGPLQADGGEGINAGYSQMLLLHDGTEVLLYHRVAPPIGCWHSTFAKGEVGYPCQCDIPYLYDVPDYHDNAVSDEPNGIWPKGTVVYDAEKDSNYIHIVTTENNDDVLGGDQTIAYQRCVFEETDIVCYSPGGLGPYRRSPNVAGNETDSIAVFDSIKCISAIVVSSPFTRRVTIVYTKNREDSQVNNDVVYVESMNNGDDWLNGTAWPPIKHNVSNYDPLDPERAYTDVAACYDYNDSLHIVWNGTWYDSAGGNLSVTWANLKHWSKEHGISTIAMAQWEGTWPGGWNRNISKMSISALDPIYHPGGDPDSVFLFCTWTQFNLGDNAMSGYTNGDIYASVSIDGGRTWAPGENLTNTHTPDCAPGECLSEHYSSLAENMYDGDLHIQYVCDRDPGSSVSNEGSWTDNPMMYLHLEWGPPRPCGVSIKILDPPDWCDPPVKVAPGEGRVIAMELTGIYTGGGDYEVTTNNPNVVPTLNGDGHLSPGEQKRVELTIYPPGEESFLDVTVYVHYCIWTETEDTSEIKLHVVQSEDYYECARDPATFIEKDNCKLKLWSCVNSEERVWDKRIDPEENQQVIFTGGIIVATTADGYYDTVVGRQDYRDTRTGARDTIKVVVGSMEPYFPDEPCTLQKIHSEKTFICANNLRPPESYNHEKWWWISVNKQILMFHGPDCPNWKKEQVIKYVWIKWNPPPVWWPDQSPFVDYEEIYFGVFADVDAPFDTGCNGCNAAGYDYARHIMWQHGYNAGTHPEYEEYYVGLALTDRDGGVVEPWGAHNVMCEDYLYPQGGWGWKEGELYQLAADSGVSIDHPDSVVDRTVVMTADMIPAGNDSTFDLEFILIEAFIPTGLADLQAHIDQTRDILIPELDELGIFSREFPVCGDANGDGSVDLADAVYIINYLFIGAPPPFWPITRGDANGDGSVDLADAVYLVNWLFIGGPPPNDCYGFGRG